MKEGGKGMGGGGLWRGGERENQIKRHHRKDAFDKGESLSTSEFTKSHSRRFSWRHYTGQMLGFCNINLNAFSAHKARTFTDGVVTF